MTQLPIAILGAGPVGLAAAAQATARGLGFIILEPEAQAGAAVADWGHVRIFSPWRFNIEPAARDLLRAVGWAPPDPDALPTGAELLRGYLARWRPIRPSHHDCRPVRGSRRSPGRDTAS